MDPRDPLLPESSPRPPESSPLGAGERPAGDPDSQRPAAEEARAEPAEAGGGEDAGDTVIEARLADPQPTMGRRIWQATKAFGVLVSAGVLFLAASVAMTAAAVVLVTGEFDLAHFRDPDTLQRVFGSRLGLPVIVVLPQLALAAPPIIAALLSSQATRRRLGLVRGRWPLPAWAAAAVAAPLIGMVSGAVVSLFLEQSAQLEEMSAIFRRHGQSGFLIPLALMIGVTPAICEELLFRGYLQNRLTTALGPVTGVLLASLAFAAFHMDFVHVVAVFPLGLFLGWVSWHSGSLIPAMMAHFVNNVVSVVAVVLAPAGDTDMLALPGILFSLAILGLGGLGLATVTITAWLYGRPERTAQGA